MIKLTHITSIYTTINPYNSGNIVINVTASSSPALATASSRPTDDLVLISKHSTAPSSPPPATNPWTLLNGPTENIYFQC